MGNKTEYVIDVKATDNASGVFNRIAMNAQKASVDIAGKIGGGGAVKDIIEGVGRTFSTGKSIKAEFDAVRLQAYVDLRDELAKINTELANAETSEIRRAKLIQIRIDLEKQYKSTVEQADKNESRAQGQSRFGKGVGILLAVDKGAQVAAQMAGGFESQRDKDIAAGYGVGTWKGTFSALGEANKSIPIIGSIGSNLDKLMLSLGGFNREMKELDGIAQKQIIRVAEIRAAGQQNDASLKASRDAVAEAIGGRVRIENDLSNKLKEIEDKRDAARRGAMGLRSDLAKQLADEEYVARSKATEQITALEVAAADKYRQLQEQKVDADRTFRAVRLQIYRDTVDTQDRISSDAIRFSGDQAGAELATIRGKFAAEVRGFQDQIEAARNDRSLSPGEQNDKIRALQTRIDASNAERDQALTQARGSAIDRISKTAMQSAADGGNPEAKNAMETLRIVEKYRDVRREIEDLRRQGNLSDQQRKILNASEASLAGSERGELAKVGMHPSSQGFVAPMEDGRFNGSLIAARAEMQAPREDLRVASKTADNTGTLITKVDDLIALVRSAFGDSGQTIGDGGSGEPW